MQGDHRTRSCGEPEPDPAIAQRADIKTAIDAPETAVATADNDLTDAELSAVDAAMTAATNVPATQRIANTGTVDAIAGCEKSGGSS